MYQQTRTKRCRIIQRIIRLFVDRKKDAPVHTLAHNKGKDRILHDIMSCG